MVSNNDKRRSARAIRWIERYCRVPSGPQKGHPAHLSMAQEEVVRQIYDNVDAPVPATDDSELAAYLALLHIVGPEAVRETPVTPMLTVDPWTVWNACDDPYLRQYLKREPDAVVCPQLGTRYPRAA